MPTLVRLLSLASLALACACSNQIHQPAAIAPEPGPAPSPPVAPAASDTRPERSAEQTSRPPAASAAGAAAEQPPRPAAESGELPAAASGERAYPGGEVVVHEWGTDTVVVGSDGSLQRGLQHEGDDLPEFVYDRTRQGDLLGFPALDKMETPVIYFYSDTPRTVSVRVNMPRGVLTQWYPAVAAFSPPIYNATHGPTLLVDPVSDIDYVYGSAACQQKYTAPVMPGVLDWGNVQILARDAAPRLLDAPLDRFTWSYARQVAANAVRVENPARRVSPAEVSKDAQEERFLFYRGLGHFEPPLRATTTREAYGDVVHLQELAEPVATPMWLLHVAADKGAYTPMYPGKVGIAAGVPSLDTAQPMAAFSAALATELSTALTQTGMYHDEARAMVNTWRSQWFGTPGVRVLYFAPDAWLERELPLTITPAPASVERVMVMRMELLTTSQESADVAGMLQEASAQRDYFQALGRFAEPRLRRAMQLVGSGKTPPSAQDLLHQIQGPNAINSLGP